MAKELYQTRNFKSGFKKPGGLYFGLFNGGLISFVTKVFIFLQMRSYWMLFTRVTSLGRSGTLLETQRPQATRKTSKYLFFFESSLLIACSQSNIQRRMANWPLIYSIISLEGIIAHENRSFIIIIIAIHSTRMISHPIYESSEFLV